MDKSTDILNSTQDISLKPPVAQFPLAQPQRVYNSLEEAFAAFEEDATDGVEVPLPPIPAAADVQKMLFQNALLLVDSGEYELARNILTEVLKHNSQWAEALRWVGWCYKQEGYTRHARAVYEKVISLRQTDQDFLELGEIYYAQNEDHKAIESWQNALSCCSEESPHLFDLHKNLGNAFTRIGDYEGAEENYNKAVTLRRNSDALWVNMGTLAFQRQNYLQAMTHYKQALEINAYNDKAWCGVGLVAWEMKDGDWAKAATLKALDINPHNEVALSAITRWKKNGD